MTSTSASAETAGETGAELLLLLLGLFLAMGGTTLFDEPAGRIAQAQASPNIIVIQADDLDVKSLDHALSLGWMPNLQQHLIDVGTTFTNSFVSNSLCCPSRATFLTQQQCA